MYRWEICLKEEEVSMCRELKEKEITWFHGEVGSTENGTLTLLSLNNSTPPPKSILFGKIKMVDFK